jgi:hypothetical protein
MTVLAMRMKGAAARRSTCLNMPALDGGGQPLSGAGPADAN